MNWSEQQNSIFGWFDGSAPDATRNLGIIARAGTGKTTTIVEGVKRAPETSKVICAFNKRIADELTARGVFAKTLHALGFAAVSKWYGKVIVAKGNDRRDDLTNRVVGSRLPEELKKLVSKLHTLAREMNPLATGPADLLDIAEAFECMPSPEWIEDGFTTEDICGFAYKAMVLAAEEKPVRGIDFADMIYLPIRNRMLRPTYELVVVDEAQDMTLAQLLIARGICKGRIAFVGDNRQAIYSFRGADSSSMSNLLRELDATERKLTITYRCGRVIVDLAAEIVPDFEAGPSNPEGQIVSLPKGKLVAEAAAGDFILSRLTAPLVSVAMSLLREGKRTKIAGRDIGAGLKALVRKLTKSARSVPEFIERLEGWREREVKRAEKLRNPEPKIEAILDQAEMLASLADGVKNVAEIESRIDALFTDDGLGSAGFITCSTVHRSKGLEAERVFILTSTLRNDSEEEMNIQYVAITRAKKVLTMVSETVAA